MLFLLHAIVVSYIFAGNLAFLKEASRYDEPLGTGLDISKVQIGNSVLHKGATIFNPSPLNCMESDTYTGVSDESWDYFRKTEDMMKTSGVSAGLSASFLSLFSLGASLRGTFRKVTQTSKSMSGFTHSYFIHTKSSYLDKNCLRKLELNSQFVRDFKALRRYVSQPHLFHSWSDYWQFMRRYGTHYVTDIKYGSSATQYLSAESSLNYKQRDFEAKACLDLSIPVKVGLVHGGLCGGYFSGKRTSTAYDGISGRLIVLGGRDETRNKVIRHKRLSDIEQLLNEGRNFQSPVLYKYESIVDLLKMRFAETPYKIQAANFKAFVEGYVNFNCYYKKKGNIELQKFERGPVSFAHPFYMCTLSPEGCKQNSDCRLRFFKCRCRGDTCVEYRQSTSFSVFMKTVALFNNRARKREVHKYCKFSEFQCKCKRPSPDVRELVWPLELKKAREMIA